MSCQKVLATSPKLVKYIYMSWPGENGVKSRRITDAALLVLPQLHECCYYCRPRPSAR